MTADGETHTTALKRKYQAAQDENQQLRELIDLIHERPYVEATEIFRRIRMNDDPLTVLKLIKEADLLLPLNSPSGSDIRESGLLQIQEGPQVSRI